MLQDSNLKKENGFENMNITRLEFGAHHCENLLQVGSQGIGQ